MPKSICLALGLILGLSLSGATAQAEEAGQPAAIPGGGYTCTGSDADGLPFGSFGASCGDCRVMTCSVAQDQGYASPVQVMNAEAALLENRASVGWARTEQLMKSMDPGADAGPSPESDAEGSCLACYCATLMGTCIKSMVPTAICDGKSISNENGALACY